MRRRRTAERRLRALLRDAEVPGSRAAAERSWEAVHAALGAREPSGTRRAAAVLCGAAAVGAVAALALASPGDALARWLREIVAGPPAPPRTVLGGGLPAAGRLLVTASSGVWVVERDGRHTRLGPYAGAAWSPSGRFAAAWRQRQLAALAPDGTLRWRVSAPGRLQTARWAPDGFLVAYRVSRPSGDELWLVAGDGTGAHRLDAGIGPAAPAWRPRSPHTVAWLGSSGRLVIMDAARGRLVWRSAAPLRGVRRLTWSADGARLVALGRRRLTLVDLATERLRQRHLDPGRSALGAAWAPDRDRIAVVDSTLAPGRTRVTSRVVLLDRRLRSRGVIFEATGVLTAPLWSPDGRWVLVGWPLGDQWLAIPAAPGRRAGGLSGVSRTFAGRVFPTPRDWCCP